MKTGTAMAPARATRNLVTTDPFAFLQNRLNRLFEGFPPFLEEQLSLATWTPPCDVYETEKDLIIKAELPGVSKDNVFVALEGTTLIIHGERAFEEETKRENYHRVERDYGEFMRSFTLPAFVEPNKMVAEFKDGVLTLTLPKREEARPKQIEIKVK